MFLINIILSVLSIPAKQIARRIEIYHNYLQKKNYKIEWPKTFGVKFPTIYNREFYLKGFGPIQKIMKKPSFSKKKYSKNMSNNFLAPQKPAKT